MRVFTAFCVALQPLMEGKLSECESPQLVCYRARYMLFNTDSGHRPAAPHVRVCARVQKHAYLKTREHAYVNRPGRRSPMAWSRELSPDTGFPYQEGMLCSPKAHTLIVSLMKDFSLSNLSVFIGILRTARTGSLCSSPHLGI